MKNLAFYLIFFSIIALPTFTIAESSCKCEADNTAEEKPEEKNSFWDKSLALGFSLTDGNNDTSLFTTEANVKYEKDKNTLTLNASHNIGDNDGETNVDNTMVNAQYQRLFADKSYFGIGESFLRNEISDVKYRSTTNVLYGFHLLKGESVDLSLEIGPSYIFEEVGSISDNYLAYRVADSFEFEISKTSRIFQNSELIVQAENSDNYLINSKIGIEAKMTETLSLVSTLTSLYDNVPAAGKKRHDLIAVTALAVSF